jgi:protein-glucosylgalactosylhydroxylysine glucosidase
MTAVSGRVPKLVVTAPISPPPVTGASGDQLPAYVSNGVIGLRVMPVPLQPGLAMLNGLAALHPVLGIEYSPEVPYPLAGDLAVGDVRLSHWPHCASQVEQRYDFACGELHSRFRAELADTVLDVDVLTFASRSHPALVLQEVAVTASRACELTLTALVSTAGVPGGVSRRIVGVGTDDGDFADGLLRFEPNGAMSSTGVAMWTEVAGDAAVDRERADWWGNGDLAVSYRVTTRRGRTYRLRQIAAMVPSSMHSIADHHAVRLLQSGTDLGFDELRRRNTELWQELWRGRLVLLGADEEWQARADAAFFYLHSSVHRSSPASTSIFGLAQWRNYHYYYGHVMWDIEAFSLPPLLLTQPEAAAAMLAYRHRTLPTTMHNAQLHGRRGAQFPWQSGPTHGEESAPLGALGPSYEDHVGCVVAHAFAQYAFATGHPGFAAEQAWPVVAGVAEWIESRVTWTERGVEIHRAMGVAERSQPFDNDAFTNIAAAAVLRAAVTLADQTGATAPEAWAVMADRMVLAVRDDVILDHDGFRSDEEKAATPSAPAALLLFDHPVDPAVASATRRAYLDRADEYVGSPMLSSLLGVFAAHEGERRRSAALFEEGYARFCSERFANVHEYRPDRFPDEPVAGPFYANLSGFLLACLYGLGHVRVGPGPPASWCRPGPIVMPSLWEGVEVERVWAHGGAHRLVACHGDERACIEPLR